MLRIIRRIRGAGASFNGRTNEARGEWLTPGRRSRFKPILWILGFLGITALGTWGWADRIDAVGREGYLSAAYRALQLFGLNFDDEPRAPLFKFNLDDEPSATSELPTALQFARFLAPTFTVVAFVLLLGISIVRAVLAYWARMVRTRTAVLIGYGSVGQGIARALDEELRIVAVDRTILPADRRRAKAARVTVIEADPGDPATFDDGVIGLGWADRVIVACGADADSLVIAADAAKAIDRWNTRKGKPAGSGPLVWVNLSDQRMVRRLRDRQDAESAFARLRPMSMQKAAAQELLAEAKPALLARDLGQGAVHVVLCGFGDTGWAIAEQIVLDGRLPPALARPLISVIDRDAAVADAWRAAHPQLDAYADIAFFTGDIGTIRWAAPEDDVLTRIAARAAPTLYVFATGDAGANIVAALTVRDAMATQRIAPCPVAIGARERAQVPLTLAWRGRDLTDRLIVFGSAESCARWLVAVHPGIEQLAQDIHDDYAALFGGPAFGALSPSLRQSNIRAAAHMGSKLVALGFETADFAERCFGLGIPDLDRVDDLPNEDIRRLSAFEHVRWSADRVLDGWTVGAADDARRQRPNLGTDVGAYGRLAAEERDKDDRQICAAFASLRRRLGQTTPLRRVETRRLDVSPVWSGSRSTLGLGFQAEPDWHAFRPGDARDRLRLLIAIPDEPPLVEAETPKARASARRHAYAAFVAKLPTRDLDFRLIRSVPRGWQWLPAGAVDGR